MSPTIVLASGRPVLVVGGSGGPTIISGVVQVTLGALVHGLDVRAAVAEPRIHDQAIPPVLAVEEGVPPVVRRQLERLGHRVSVVPVLGAVSAVATSAAGTLEAAGDARKDGGGAVVR
jgi:gamma-glutamyltranspeptidase/glutathione hydrolase